MPLEITKITDFFFLFEWMNELREKDGEIVKYKQEEDKVNSIEGGKLRGWQQKAVMMRYKIIIVNFIVSFVSNIFFRVI